MLLDNAGKCVVFDFAHVANIDTTTIQVTRYRLSKQPVTME